MRFQNLEIKVKASKTLDPTIPMMLSNVFIQSLFVLIVQPLCGDV